MAIVKLKTYGSVFEATLVKGRLENEGIPCFLTNENFSSLMPHYFNILGSGVHLYVEKSYYDKAISLIHNTERKIRGEKSVLKMTCPACGSKNITHGLGKKKNYKWTLIIFSLLFTIPFNNINTYFQCKDCKAEFKN